MVCTANAMTTLPKSTEAVPYALANTSGRGGRLRRHHIGRKLRSLDDKTRPWTERQYIYLDGKPYCYTVEPDGIGTVVHLPGGGSFMLREAWARKKYHITAQQELRLDDSYERKVQAADENEEEIAAAGY